MVMRERLARALAFPFEALPALVLAWLCLRIAGGLALAPIPSMRWRTLALGLARAGAGVFQATFTNRGAARSPQFVPLLVVTNEHGLQLLESAAPLRTLAPGTYFMSALPSDPATGRSLGGGQYHVEAGL